MGNSWTYPYRTGWINRSDWTNVHLGSNTTLNTDSNVTHGLNAPLPKLLVKLFVSTDGTDANSFEVKYGETGNTGRGFTVFAVDNNNVKIQTGTGGIDYVLDDGTCAAIDIENWYYQVVVWYLG